MPTAAATQHLAAIDRIVSDWRSRGRSEDAVASLQAVARRDPFLTSLVLDGPAGSPPCPTPCDLVAHMRRAESRVEREEAARVVRVLLREMGHDAHLCRLLVQALLPGLITVAAKLRWGRGGEWQTPDEFFADLMSTAWILIGEWAGQDRPYAVLDLLSAIRCRVRRQLFHFKEQAPRTVSLEDHRYERCIPPESDLETLARALIDLRREGMRADDAQVLYMHHVLGYSMAELAVLTGRDRRALYARRDRGRRRVCA